MPEPPFRFYVDRNNFCVRMVFVTREADARRVWNGQRDVVAEGSENVMFDWPTSGGWGRGALVSKDDVHETIEAAIEQLRGFIEQGKQHA